VQRLELGVRRPARAHEVRVVCIREAIRVGASTACSSSASTRSTAPAATRTSAMVSVPFA
jgi:hypothetical protein